MDGKELIIDELEKEGLYNSNLAIEAKKQRKATPVDLSLPMIGCSLSHVNIYRDILKNGYQQVLILEDDLSINPRGTVGFLNAIQELPADWELLYLGYLDSNNVVTKAAKWRIKLAYPVLSAFGFNQYDPHRLRCKYPRNFSEHLERSGYHYGTHSYAVTDKGARKILEFQTPVKREADNALGEMCMNETINAFNLKKKVFYQNREELESTIS